MRIVMDLQGAQGENRNRGIGRYSMSIAKAIVREASGHEVWLALNGALHESIESIRSEFDGLLPQDRIRVWHPLADGNPSARGHANELLREAFLASLEPDVVHVTSLFEGLASEAVTSVGKLATSIPTAVTLYDLIPYIYQTPYLDQPHVRRWYLEKLGHLRRAHMLLGISESARSEAIRYLGVPPVRAVNVSTAADEHFRQIPIAPIEEQHLRQKYGLTRPFVMYTGGIDHRKNIDGLVRSYARLPKELRNGHQLAIVCAASVEDRQAVHEIGQKHGLEPGDVVLTGFVPEHDLVLLYNLCQLFVFPSFHEGFGLPVLEAMQCGAPVVGADASSVPEVIGLQDALFDPRSNEAMTAKIAEALTDEGFRRRLKRNGDAQSKRFSWQGCAQRAMGAFEALLASREGPAVGPPQKRPKLAYVSPLPPARSGIADYSAELLPELARFYDIDAIVAQTGEPDPVIAADCALRSPEWFLAHWRSYDRVMYHFGNSDFHEYMFDLLERVPGVVVLHDFFLSGLQAHREVHLRIRDAWVAELYRSHGYEAVRARFHAADTANVVYEYPCNFSVIKRALGVIVHSRYSRELAATWYGPEAARDWQVIPLLRAQGERKDRRVARQRLGIGDDEFVVCSFGLLGPTKQNHRLLDAWLASGLARDPRCRLIYVGENDPGQYGQQLVRTIDEHVMADVDITGWVDMQTFQCYLDVADLAVQLRTMSRGETSAAILDCMKAGVPAIVNANGSMSDLPRDAVCILPDQFSDAQLIEALQDLHADSSRRSAMAERGMEIVRTVHDPRRCAESYASAIESMYADADRSTRGLVMALAGSPSVLEGELDVKALASAVAKSMPSEQPARQLLVDVSELVQRDANTGIQRVVRSILKQLLEQPPAGFRVEPVYATATSNGYYYARKFTLGLLGCPTGGLRDLPVDVQPNDVFLGLDLQPHVVPAQSSYYRSLRNQGVRVVFVVYDLIPVLHPDAFLPGAKLAHEKWLRTIAGADGAICISQAVADELAEWVAENVESVGRPLRIDWFHLGADVEQSFPSTGLPADAGRVMSALGQRPSFLMVGTLEPRKCHAQVLAAFDQLWAEGVDVNLVIVGKQGWMVDELALALKRHPEAGLRLHWLIDTSDEFLEQLYQHSTALILASKAEGFGLPLIEAARHHLAIIARDIPVFREVAGEHAFYFKGGQPVDIARAVQAWLALWARQAHPLPEGLEPRTWRQSVEELKQIMLQ